MSNGLFDGVGMLPDGNTTVPEAIRDFGNDNGVYVETVELENWGPFNGVYEIPLKGFPALLVGENGTGKSSLMDAILTLLVSPRDLRYNSASDNQAGSRSRSDERTLMEYVLGVAGSSLSEDSTGIRKNMRYLRQTGQLSIILIRFRVGIDFLTLANVFLAEEGRKDPQRFYVFAKRPLSIRNDFSFNCSSFEEYRAEVGKLKGVTATPDRAKYFQFVRTEVGLINDNAMRLLQKLSSMKSLPKPDEFIREHMLPGQVDYKAAFSDMKRGLEEISEVEVRLKAQRRMYTMLESMAPHIEKALSLQEEKKLWSSIGEKARPFVFNKGKEAAVKEISVLENKKASFESKLQEYDKKRTSLISLKATLEAQRNNEGGLAIRQKELELSALCDEKSRKAVLYNKFTEALSAVGITNEITNAYEFKEVSSKLQEKKNTIGTSYQKAVGARSLAEDVSNKAGTTYRELLAQKRRLDNDKISIDSRLVFVRDEVCAALGVPVDTMPFFGDFLSVKEGEESWRPALEHLLYYHSVSFLVPEELLTKVTAHLRTHKRSGVHVRFLAMKPVTKSRDKASDAPEQAWEKIVVKKGHPYTQWVEGYLKTVAANYCCDTPEEFADYFPALMQDGQIRANLVAHRKDENKDIFNPKNFVMNGSFEEKKKALEQECAVAEKEFEEARKAFGQTAVAVRDIETQKEVLDGIPYVSAFDEIDVMSVESSIENCREAIAVLSSNKKMENIKSKIEDTEHKITELAGTISQTREEANMVVSKLGVLQEQVDTNQEVLDVIVFTENEKEILGEMYGKYCPQSANPKFESIMAVVPKMSSLITRRFNEVAEESNRENREAESRMRAYLDEFKSRKNDLLADISIPGEAQKFLAERDKVKDDSLPAALKALEEVKGSVQLNALQNFVTVMTVGVESEIKKAVEDVNKALRKVPYSQGADPTFLQVNCLQNRDGDVVYLRQMLSGLAKSGALSLVNGISVEEMEDVMGKAGELIEFLEPRAARIRKASYSQDNILDPRNWYVFPVSVCREVVMANGETEIVHVKELDKTNKQSSGEGEKFTYFILAACFAIWMHLLDNDYMGHTLRFLMIDEIGNKLTSSNLRDVVSLFGLLRIQLVSILPYGDKVSEYEGFVGNIIQTDWLDKAAGESFVDTVSLLEYAQKNRERTEEMLKRGVSMRDKVHQLETEAKEKSE